MMPASTFLADLERAASASAEAEAEFRRSVGARIAALEQERAIAFRRLNLMRGLSEAVSHADDRPAALGAGRAMLAGRLGWQAMSEAREEVLGRFETVVGTLTAPAAGEQAPGETADPARALAAFEAWYAASRGSPFWRLFDTAMPETPLVDF